MKLKACFHKKNLCLSLATSVVFSTLLTFHAITHYQPSLVEGQGHHPLKVNDTFSENLLIRDSVALTQKSNKFHKNFEDSVLPKKSHKHSVDLLTRGRFVTTLQYNKSHKNIKYLFTKDSVVTTLKFNKFNNHNENSVLTFQKTNKSHKHIEESVLKTQNSKNSHKNIENSVLTTQKLYNSHKNIEDQLTRDSVLTTQKSNSSHKKFEERSKVEVTKKLIPPPVRSLHGTGCKQWFEPTFEENLKVVSKYQRGNVQKYLSKISGNRTKPEKMLTKFPVLVTAAGADHFPISQGLLKSIHEILIPKYGDIKIVYYDLGLTGDQIQQLNKYCKCEVRQFQFDEFPNHIRQLRKYTWKPIIVKTLLMEYGWVWWMDSSARFLTSDLDLALQYSQNNSVLFFTYGASLSVAQHTDKRTLAFLGEDACKFRNLGELEAGFVLYHFDHVTNIIVDQWAACALWQDCMAPVGAILSCRTSIKNDGQCHRFDQAVLSVIVRRLFHEINDYPDVKIPLRIHIIRRGETVNYFPD